MVKENYLQINSPLFLTGIDNCQYGDDPLVVRQRKSKLRSLITDHLKYVFYSRGYSPEFRLEALKEFVRRMKQIMIVPYPQVISISHIVIFEPIILMQAFSL